MICMDAPVAKSTSRLSDRILAVRNAPDLNAREKAVARVLLDHVGNREDGICWPSIGRIAREASLSVRTVQRAVQGLRSKRYISSDPRHREDGAQTSSVYRWLDSLVPLGPLSGGPASSCHGGGDTVSPKHKKHKQPINKQHVSACSLNSDVSEKSRGGSQTKLPTDKEAKTLPAPQRFIAFKENPKEFLTHEACAEGHQKAVAAGFITASQSDEILFWTLYAAVCRKLRAKKVRFPARLLRVLLDSRKAMVQYATQADEDTAREALKQFRAEAVADWQA